MKKIILENRTTSLLYLLLITAIFIVGNYYFFLNNYKKIEINTNQKHIQYLIHIIDTQVKKYNGDTIPLKKVDNTYKYLIQQDMIDFFDSVKYLKTTNYQNIGVKNPYSNYFDNIYVHTIKEELLINYINYHDKDNNHLFSIKTINEREVINTGHKTLSLFVLMFVIFLAILLIVIRKYYHAIKNHNERLEEKVEKRTSQIQSTLFELEKANLKLYEMAHTDHLTKIRNRRNFFIHAENLFAQAKRKNKDFCVIMIDIDNFKTINDTYGHNVGDKALVVFTQAVQKHLNDTVIFGRLGGEEFAIVAFDMTLDETMQWAETIRSEVEKAAITLDKSKLYLTASFGVSDMRECKDLDQVLHKADTMLYSAKHTGKNRVRSRLN